MKKRKSPVVLVTLLVITILSVAALRNFDPRTLAQKPAGSDQTMGDSRDSATKEQIHGTLAKNKGAGPDGVEPAGRPTDEEPSIIEPEVAQYVPQPNDAMTSVQWWDKKSRASKMEGQVTGEVSPEYNEPKQTGHASAVGGDEHEGHDH